MRPEVEAQIKLELIKLAFEVSKKCGTDMYKEYDQLVEKIFN